MIDAKEKAKEKKGKSKKVEESNKRLLEFWNLLKRRIGSKKFKLLRPCQIQTKLLNWIF